MGTPKLVFIYAKEQVELVRIILPSLFSNHFSEGNCRDLTKRTKFHKYFSYTLVFIFLCDRLPMAMIPKSWWNLSQRNMKTSETREILVKFGPILSNLSSDLQKSHFYVIYIVLSRNLFCRGLGALVWRKIEPKIVHVEKKGQIWGMSR